MAVNIQAFVSKQSKLVTKRSSTRVSKLDLTGKKIRGDVKLHIVPDVNGLPMLTTKDVFEIHETETYTYQDETRTRYPLYIIPNSSNYNTVDGAVMPTDMQLKKLDKLYDLLSTYRDLTNLYQPGGAKLDTKNTETKLWIKAIGTYTKMWAKISDLKPTNPDPKAKQPDFSKITMVTHASANFVKAFNKWATPDVDSEISVDDQLKKIESVLSNEVGDGLRCVKISTKKSDGIGYEVEFKNVKPEVANVSLTQEDLSEASSLIAEDWDYTVFDDEKVDKLIAKLEKYLEEYTPSEDEEDYEEEEESGEENPFEEDEE